MTNLAAGYPYEVNATTTDYENNRSGTPGYYTSLADINFTWNGPNECQETDDVLFPITFSNGKGSKTLKIKQAGKYSFKIIDDKWTRVDHETAYMQHHVSPYYRSPNETDCLIERDVVRKENEIEQNGCVFRSDHPHRGIQYTDINVTLHPYRFDLSNVQLHTRPLDGQTWSYMNDLSDNKVVAVTLEGNVTARGADGGILSNYTENCMAADGKVGLEYRMTPTEIVTIDTGEEVEFQQIVVDPFDTEYLPDSEGNLSFVKGNFAAGDLNGSGALMFYSSLRKDTEHPVNVSDINYTKLHYFGINDQAYADGAADRMPDGEKGLDTLIHFYYAKVTPDRDPDTHQYWYRILNYDKWTAPLKVRSYCKNNLTIGLDCEDGTHPFDPLSSEHDPEYAGSWYLMQTHNSSENLGKVQSLTITNASSATVTPDSNILFDSGISTVPIEVQYSLGSPRPHIVKIKISPDPWLVYTPDENFTVFFDKERLRWKGEGKTGNVILTEPNTGDSKRINW